MSWTDALRKIFDPFLEFRNSDSSTKALVITVTTEDIYNTATINFRGKTLTATCAHPGIAAGTMVNVIESPRGVFFITNNQPSWFLVPASEALANGRVAQVALAELMRFNKKYWPSVDMIPNSEPIPPEPPEPTYADPNNDTHTFDDYDINDDGYLDRTEWPYDPALFDIWDLNGDGLIDIDEWYKRGYDPAFWPVSGWLAWVDSTGGMPNVYMVQRVGGTDYPSNTGDSGLPWLANYFGSPYKAPILTEITIGGKNRRYIRGYSGSTLLRLKIGIENGAIWWVAPGDAVARTTAAHEAYKATLGTQTLCIYTVGSGIQAWNIDLTRVTASAPVPPGATGSFYIGDYWEIIL